MVENTAEEIKSSVTGCTVLTLKLSYILLKLLHSAYKCSGIIKLKKWKYIKSTEMNQ